MTNPLDARLVIDGLLGKIIAGMIMGLMTWVIYNSHEQSKLIVQQTEQVRFLSVQLEKMDKKIEQIDIQSDDQVKKNDLDKTESRLQNQISEVRSMIVRLSERVSDIERGTPVKLR